MAKTDLITTTRYNTIQSGINSILGPVSTGYGQSLLSSQIATTVPMPLISALQMQKLRTDIAKARQHQTGFDELAKIPNILATYTIQDSDFQSMEDMLGLVTTNKLTIDLVHNATDSNDLAQLPLTPDERSALWNAEVWSTVRAQFLDEAQANYFFNAGGSVTFNALMTSPNGAKSDDWHEMLSAMRNIHFNSGSTTCNGVSTSGPLTPLGFRQLTTTYQTIFTAGGTGVYSTNSYAIQAKRTILGGDTSYYIDFNIRFIDAVLETGTGDLSVYGDLAVDGVLKSTVGYIWATGNNVIVTPPTLTTIHFLNASPGVAPGYRAAIAPVSAITPLAAIEGELLTLTATTYGLVTGSTVWYKFTTPPGSLNAVVDADFEGGLIGSVIVNTKPSPNTNPSICEKIFTKKIATDNFIDPTSVVLELYDADPNTTGVLKATSNIVIVKDYAGIALVGNHLSGPGQSSIDETTPDNVITFTATTTGIPDGSTLVWTASNAANGQVLGALTGNFDVNSGTGSFYITARNDNTTDGDINFTVVASINGVVSNTWAVTIKDTSKTPVPSFTVADVSASYNEGQVITFTIDTLNMSDGSVINWNIPETNGITASDFESRRLTGAVYVNTPEGSTIGTGTQTIQIANDNSVNEGDETFTITFTNPYSTGTPKTVTKTIKISDTSAAQIGISLGATYLVMNETTNKDNLITVTMVNAKHDDALTWSITSISPTTASVNTADFTTSMSGTEHLVVPAGSTTGTATFWIRAVADGELAGAVAEGLETFTLSVTHTKSNATQSLTIGINDTSAPAIITADFTVLASPAVITSNQSSTLTVSNLTGMTDATTLSWEITNPLGVTTLEVPKQSGTVSANKTFAIDAKIVQVAKYLTIKVSTADRLVSRFGNVSLSLPGPSYVISYPNDIQVESASPGTLVTHTVTTTNVSAGTPIYWKITGVGIDATDFGGMITGTVNAGSLTTTPTMTTAIELRVVDDFITEANQTYILSLFTDESRTIPAGAPVSVVIADFVPPTKLSIEVTGGIPGSTVATFNETAPNNAITVTVKSTNVSSVALSYSAVSGVLLDEFATVLGGTTPQAAPTSLTLIKDTPQGYTYTGTFTLNVRADANTESGEQFKVTATATNLIPANAVFNINDTSVGNWSVSTPNDDSFGAKTDITLSYIISAPVNTTSCSYAFQYEGSPEPTAYTTIPLTTVNPPGGTPSTSATIPLLIPDDFATGVTVTAIRKVKILVKSTYNNSEVQVGSSNFTSITYPARTYTVTVPTVPAGNTTLPQKEGTAKVFSVSGNRIPTTGFTLMWQPVAGNNYPGGNFDSNDYTKSPLSLSFTGNNGTGSATCTVTLINDNNTDPGEIYQIALYPSYNSSTSTFGSAVYSANNPQINIDDTSTSPLINYGLVITGTTTSLGSYYHSEGNTATFTITSANSAVTKIYWNMGGNASSADFLDNVSFGSFDFNVATGGRTGFVDRKLNTDTPIETESYTMYFYDSATAEQLGRNNITAGTPVTNSIKSSTINITDTSDGEWSVSVTPTTVNEGADVEFVIKAVGCPAGTQFKWAINTSSTVVATDYTLLSTDLPNTLATTKASQDPAYSIAVVQFRITMDQLSEGVTPETLGIVINHATKTKQLAASDLVKINDTSLTQLGGTFTVDDPVFNNADSKMYSVVTLTITYPVNTPTGTVFDFTLKGYLGTDINKVTLQPLASNTGVFTKGTDQAYSLKIARPHLEYNIVATISKSNYASYTLTRNVPAVQSVANNAIVTYKTPPAQYINDRIDFHINNGYANELYDIQYRNINNPTWSPFARNSDQTLRSLDKFGENKATQLIQPDNTQITINDCYGGTSSVPAIIETRVLFSNSNEYSPVHRTRFVHKIPDVAVSNSSQDTNNFFEPGNPMGGGYNGGAISNKPNSLSRADYLIVADRNTLPSTYAWGDITTAFPERQGPPERGWLSTLAMGSPLSEQVLAIRDGGFSDWYIPSVFELDVIYYQAKPTTQSNFINPVPNTFNLSWRSLYTAHNPGRTINYEFQSTQAFTEDWYWTSTEVSQYAALAINFGTGEQRWFNKSTLLKCRPIRRMPVDNILVYTEDAHQLIINNFNASPTGVYESVTASITNGFFPISGSQVPPSSVTRQPTRTSVYPFDTVYIPFAVQAGKTAVLTVTFSQCAYTIKLNIRSAISPYLLFDNLSLSQRFTMPADYNTMQIWAVSRGDPDTFVNNGYWKTFYRSSSSHPYQVWQDVITAVPHHGSYVNMTITVEPESVIDMYAGMKKFGKIDNDPSMVALSIIPPASIDPVTAEFGENVFTITYRATNKHTKYLIEGLATERITGGTVTTGVVVTPSTIVAGLTNTDLVDKTFGGVFKLDRSAGGVTTVNKTQVPQEGFIAIELSNKNDNPYLMYLTSNYVVSMQAGVLSSDKVRVSLIGAIFDNNLQVDPNSMQFTYTPSNSVALVEITRVSDHVVYLKFINCTYNGPQHSIKVNIEFKAGAIRGAKTGATISRHIYDIYLWNQSEGLPGDVIVPGMWISNSYCEIPYDPDTVTPRTKEPYVTTFGILPTTVGFRSITPGNLLDANIVSDWHTRSLIAGNTDISTYLGDERPADVTNYEFENFSNTNICQLTVPIISRGVARRWIRNYRFQWKSNVTTSTAFDPSFHPVIVTHDYKGRWNIGEFYAEQGGYYAGETRIKKTLATTTFLKSGWDVNSQASSVAYAIFVAQKNQGEASINMRNRTVNALNPLGVTAFIAGLNSQNLNGFSDWILPQKDVMQTIYFNLKPTNYPNDTAPDPITGLPNGTNVGLLGLTVDSVKTPPSYVPYFESSTDIWSNHTGWYPALDNNNNYQTFCPAMPIQTTLLNWKEGSAEAFGRDYWTNDPIYANGTTPQYQYSGNRSATQGMAYDMHYGFTYLANFSETKLVRAVRLVQITVNPSTNSIGTL